MKQLAVISGKGGTGKTSVVGALAALSGNCVLADCDVDAADLHLLLAPTLRAEQAFEGGLLAINDLERCSGCGKCLELCRFAAIGPQFAIDPLACEGCGACADLCPQQSIELRREPAGRWFISDTRLGRLVHARLNPGQDNSGKLVAQVKRAAAEQCAQNGCELLILDGPPGIGCPVISTLSGVDLALLVSEPSPSGLHDMERALRLAQHFRVPAVLCVNRCDIDADQTAALERRAEQLGARAIGRIPYDRAVTQAQLRGLTLPELGCGPALEALRQVQQQLWSLLFASGGDNADL